MKAKEALSVLGVSRSTLKRYRELGLIEATLLPTGQYDYDKESIFFFKNKQKSRKSYIYGCVSTPKQKKDLENQIEYLEEYCKLKGIIIDETYKDVASGISFKNRKEFFKMLDSIIKGEVREIVISHKDRLSRVGFELFEHLFNHYGTKIIIASKKPDERNDEK